MAAKFFTGLPLDGPDPECVRGLGAEALSRADPAAAPRPAPDHSHRSAPVPGRRSPVPVTIGARPAGSGDIATAPMPLARQRSAADAGAAGGVPARACDQDPLAGFAAGRP
jgi:hypothetical protein